MYDKYGFNENLNYPSLDLNNQCHSDKNLQNISFNLNLNPEYTNNAINSNKNVNINTTSNKIFNIKISDSDIYIAHTKKNLIIRIPKNFNNKIFMVDNEYEYISLNQIEAYQADSILGIFDINNNKYLAIVTSAKVAAKVLGQFLFNIISIELIKITNNLADINENNIKQDIINLFSTKNFYFSNDFDLSLSLYNQYKINSYDYNGNNSNKKQLKSKYLINSTILKYFAENNIPECFYSTIIYGYVGCKIDVDLDETNKNLTVDIVVIERYYKNNIIFNNDIPSHVKQIELICNFKNKINKSKNVFSFIFYISSEKMKNLNDFDPCKNILIEEFEQYKNVACIINNINNNYDKYNLKDAILKFNEIFFKNKVKLIDFTSDWDKNLFFDTNYDSYNYISFYLNNSLDLIQKSAFWLVDLNNFFTEDDCCFNAFIRFMWKAIQKEINYLGLNIDIGLFNKNNNSYICQKFKEIIMKYHNDLDENKKTLYNNMNRDKFQETFDNCFSPLNSHEKTNKINTQRNYDNYNIQKNYNNYDNHTSRNKEYNYSNKTPKKQEYNNSNIKKSDINANRANKSEESPNDIKKLKVLCATWNIAGISYKSDYNITELFTQNIFYHKKVAPDIIVVAIQEIIKLSITSVLSIVSNQENVKAWTDNILYTISKVYPNIEYYELKCMDLVGIYILILVKKDLRKDIYVLDSNTTKTGVYGTMGNKGFFTVTLRCFDNLLSFGSGHFEAGQSKNADRIDTLNMLLNKPINVGDYNGYLTFKDVENWIILGDLNFRIELSYEDAIFLIKEKKYDALYGLDQFNLELQQNYFLRQNINEKEIAFDPTYKYVKGSNEYAFDEDKIRVPAWTDRIFYCKKKTIKMLTYDSIKNMRYSDHRPVVGAFLIMCSNKRNITNNKSNINKNENKYDNNPYENILKEVNYNNNINNNINRNKINLIEIDNIDSRKAKNTVNNKNIQKNSKNKNDEKIKMIYRGIDFNTEIDTKYIISKQKNNQDIYQFFQDKSKINNNNNFSMPFNNNINNNISNNNNNFDLFSNFNNNNDFNNNNSNTQGIFGINTNNNNFNYQNNNNNYNININNNQKSNNNIIDFFQ